MLDVSHALSVIRQYALPQFPRRVSLEYAAGAVLAEPLVMDIDSPPFDRATLDGFAVRAADVRVDAPLSIIGVQEAGGPRWNGRLSPGECIMINTGAPFPASADAVLMVEHTRALTGQPGEILPTQPVSSGHGVQRRGADARAGQTLLSPGVRMGPAQLAVAAASGARQLLVRRPRIAVLTTGDELLAAEERTPPGAGKIRNANRPMLLALARQAVGGAAKAPGGDILDLEPCPDREADLHQRIASVMQNADLLLISGGMSMGTRDLVPPLLRSLGFTFHIEKVRIKPGKPFLFAMAAVPASEAGEPPRTFYVAGLPGNPVSAFVTFHRFVREIISRLAGAVDAIPPFLTAAAATELPENGGRELYQPAYLDWNTPLTVAPLHWKGSADLFTLAKANALIQRPPNAPPQPAGAPTPVLILKI